MEECWWSSITNGKSFQYSVEEGRASRVIPKEIYELNRSDESFVGRRRK